LNRWLTTIVRDGKTGYLVPRCAGFFAGRLDTLLRNPDLLAHMRSQARGSVLQFSWRSVASQVLDVYHELASEARYLVAL
jgi:D-inositol-3-phosphate glycosyltransferase